MRSRRRASSRRPLAVLAFAVGCAVGFGGTGASRAQSSYQQSPLESEALDLYRRNQLVTARTRAERVLERDPDSIVGNYVMGVVLREAEGVLPRAMYHLGRAREVYEGRYGQGQVANAPWQLHREILFAVQSLAGELEEYEYQLRVLDFHDAVYDPDLTAEHAWPLLHLGRFGEARAYARRAIGAGDPAQRSLGLNGLCAIESEARQREAEHQACNAALENARRRAAMDPAAANADPSARTPVAVHAYNAAHGAAAVLRFDELERLAREGTRRQEFTIANPWRTLARLYADQGRIAEAVGAAREMQAWRARQPASLRDQDRAETDAALATLLLVVGEGEAGLRLVDRAIERPDRRGLVSSDPEQALGAHALLRRALARTAAERQAERASARNLSGRLHGGLAAAAQRTRAWPDDERIAAVLGDDDRLEATLRVYVSGGIEPVPTWLLGDLVDVLGAGVVAVALEDARARERSFGPIAAYYDALGAELALARGAESDALALAQRALAHLPAAEALLQARVAAVGAEAARRAGRGPAASSLYERAMQKDPGVIRRLGLGLPVTVRTQGGVAATLAGEMLSRSPRFRTGEAGFVLAIDAQAGNVLRACLRSPQGATLTCVETARQRREDDQAWAARLHEQFHASAFATRVGLSAADLRSLDGSNSVASQAQRERMEGILNELAREPEGALPP